MFLIDLHCITQCMLACIATTLLVSSCIPTVPVDRLRFEQACLRGKLCWRFSDTGRYVRCGWLHRKRLTVQRFRRVR